MCECYRINLDGHEANALWLFKIKEGDMQINFDVKYLRELRDNYIMLEKQISENEDIMSLDLWHAGMGSALSEIFGPLWENIDKVLGNIENFSGGKEAEDFLSSLDSGQMLSLISCILDKSEKEI